MSYGRELAIEQMISEHVAEIEADIRFRDKEWMMRDGRVIKIKDMGIAHIENCIVLINRERWSDAKRLTKMFQEELSSRCEKTAEKEMRETIQDLEDRLSKLEGILAEELWKSEEPIRQKERKRTAKVDEKFWQEYIQPPPRISQWDMQKESK